MNKAYKIGIASIILLNICNNDFVTEVILAIIAVVSMTIFSVKYLNKINKDIEEEDRVDEELILKLIEEDAKSKEKVINLTKNI